MCFGPSFIRQQTATHRAVSLRVPCPDSRHQPAVFRPTADSTSSCRNSPRLCFSRGKQQQQQKTAHGCAFSSVSVAEHQLLCVLSRPRQNSKQPLAVCLSPTTSSSSKRDAVLSTTRNSRCPKPDSFRSFEIWPIPRLGRWSRRGRRGRSRKW